MKTRPVSVTAVAADIGAGMRPTTAALPVARFTRWMARLGPAGVSPPNTQIRFPTPATAAYRTGTGRVATLVKAAPLVVASTVPIQLVPS
jgi:hypothetical protein